MPYRDTDRAQFLVEIEVENRNCTNLALPAVHNSAEDEPNISHAGKIERFKIYEDRLSEVERLVETEPHLIDEARKIYHNKIKAMLLKKELIGKDVPFEKIDFNKPEIKEEMSGFSLSLEAVFQDMHERSIKPLIYCKVIRTNIMQEPANDPLAKFRTAPVTSKLDPETLAQAAMLLKQMEKQPQTQPQQQNHNQSQQNRGR